MSNQKHETHFTHCLICAQMRGLKVSIPDGKVASIRPDKLNPYT